MNSRLAPAAKSKWLDFPHQQCPFCGHDEYRNGRPISNSKRPPPGAVGVSVEITTLISSEARRAAMRV
eukprot:scaffold322447_cov12-Prasinocladus_malaysianus.AAC.1